MSASESILFQNSRGEGFEYYTCGSEIGYPVLYMHGAVPMPFSEKLEETVKKHDLKVIVVLRPGYGASSRLKYKNVYDYALLLKEWIESLGLTHCDVLGLSAGAPYCYALAAAYPGLVNAVSICSGIPLANNGDIYRMNARAERFQFFLSRHLPAGFIGKYGVKAMEVLERKKGWQDAECGEKMDDVFQKYVRPNWYGIGRSTSVQYKSWGFKAEEIEKKIFLYHSRADEMIPIKIARKSAGLLSNSELVEYESEDHSSEKLLCDAIRRIGKRVKAG